MEYLTDFQLKTAQEITKKYQEIEYQNVLSKTPWNSKGQERIEERYQDPNLPNL